MVQFVLHRILCAFCVPVAAASIWEAWTQRCEILSTPSLNKQSLCFSCSTLISLRCVVFSRTSSRRLRGSLSFSKAAQNGSLRWPWTTASRRLEENAEMATGKFGHHLRHLSPSCFLLTRIFSMAYPVMPLATEPTTRAVICECSPERAAFVVLLLCICFLDF